MICTPPHSIPTPHPSIQNCHTSYLAHPAESINLDELFCSPLPMLRTSRLAPHHTPFVHTARTCFAYVCLPPPSSFLCILWLWFTGVHGSSNIFFSVHAHLCFLATCVIGGVDVAVGVLHECLGVFVCTQTNSGPETEHSQRQTRPRQPQARVSASRADTRPTVLNLTRLYG